MKHCNTCNTARPLSQFAKCGKSKDGYQHKCKPCQKAFGAEWYLQNRDSVASRGAAWYAANRESVAANGAVTRALNADHIRTRTAAWNKANPDKVAARTVRCRAAHPERYRARGAKWRENNPQKVQAFLQRRRSRKRNAPGEGITSAQWEEIVAYFGGRCAYCGRILALAMDHVDPLSRGGAHDVENAVLIWLITRARQRTLGLQRAG